MTLFRPARRLVVVPLLLAALWLMGVPGAAAAPVPIGVGPRVDDIMATAIPGFYMSPYEDLKLRRP